MTTRYDIETVPLADVPGSVETIRIPADGPVVIPGGGRLSDAVFARADGDLLIELPDGSRLVVSDYFDIPDPPPLATESGTLVAADVVTALAGADPFAAGESPVLAPIGRIEASDGNVTLIRADGSRTEAEVGTLIARGDRLQTGDDGSVGMLFADESTFSVGARGRAIVEDLIYDPDTGAASATFVMQQGPFSFAGGGIAATDGAFIVKTPAVSIGVDGASGAGRVEADGGTTVTYLRAPDAGDGVLRVFNPGGTDILEASYETLSVDGFFVPPTGLFRLGPRDAASHYGDAVAALPDAGAVMPATLLRAQRGEAPSSSAVDDDGIAIPDTPMDQTVGDTLQVDREAAFEIAARKAAIAAAARDAADAAIGDATAAEQAARAQAAAAEQAALADAGTAAELRAEAQRIVEESARREQAFEDAIRDADAASAQEEAAARDVAETDLAQAQAAERLAAAEEAVRQAMAAADQARADALSVLEEARAKEQAFAEAQRLAQQAEAEEEARALAVAEADAAEAAAAAALRLAEAAAELAEREAEAAERVAQEASTAAEIVEKVVERELAAVDPALLEPPSPDDPAASRGDWITRTNASMNVDAAAIAAGRTAAIAAYAQAMADGLGVESAMTRAVIAAQTHGGQASADLVLAAGPDGLIDGNADDGEIIVAGDGGGFSPADGDPSAIGSDVLIGGGGSDGLVGGFGLGGIDGTFGFNFSFTPIVVSLARRPDDERRNDAVVTTPGPAEEVLRGSSLADFLVATDAPSTVAAFEGDDFLYGDTPTNYLSGTHNATNALTNPTFVSGDADLMSGGAGDDSLWGGAGDDTLYGDVPTDASAFGFDLGSAAPGADYISGGDGDDLIDGGGGNDTLEGDDGDDNIFGYADDDILVGGQGADTLTGGAGADTFQFEGGVGASTLEQVSALGLDVIADYNASENDLFMLSDEDFGLGAAGTLTDGTNYFEAADTDVSSTPQNLSGGVANAGIVVLGAATGGGGAEIWYTDNASAMTDANSYQIASVTDADRSTIEAGDFNLKG